MKVKHRQTSDEMFDRKLSSSDLRMSKLALCLAPALYASAALALPTGQNVVQGTVAFDQIGSQLDIVNSNGAIINWQDFSINNNEIVRFIQESSASSVLNRVTSSIPSQIQGQLNSNGRVFVINPNGILIGQGAQIDVAGFVASTLNITDDDFASGNYTFKSDGVAGSVENRGFITTAKGGEVVLIAPDVSNSGVIQSQDGQILLAAGQAVSLQSLNNADISFRISAPGDTALNLGQLLAQNGSVKVFADSITQQGSISATRAVQGADGSISLEADSTVSVSGSLNVSGLGVSGGTAHVLGNEVNVSGATINASGEGGGEVLIGGDYQGAGSVKNAANATVDASTSISADGGENGDGGRVIVWSDGTTRSFAAITARGGSTKGDGGFVETSGKKTLEFGQPADVSATNGEAGTWLLDPEDINIGESEAASISSALNGGSNVEVKTSDEGDGEGNITVSSDITKTEGDTGVSLTLDAHNRVDVNASISSTAGPLSVNIRTGRQVAGVSGASSSGSTPSTQSTPTPEVVEPEVPTATDVPEVVAESVTEVVVDPASNPDTTPALGNGDTEVVGFIDQDVNQIVISENISTAGGSVSIQAGESGDAIISSSITTSSTPNTENQQAGDITIEANRIALTDDAKLDASGEDAGTILVGGDKQGQNEEVQNAEFTYVSEKAEIKADGGHTGDGGKVIVFAKDTAIVEGTITAKGGTQSGDGGFIETSGLKGLRVTKAPDASAINGANGAWLIDPYNITVGVGTTGANVAGNPWVANGTGTDAFIDQNTLRAGLLSGDVEISTTGTGMEEGNIFFEANIDFDSYGGSSTGSLTLTADNNIYFRGNLIDSNTSGDGSSTDDNINNLTLNAAGSVIFDGDNLVASAGGNMNVEVNGNINVAADNVTVLGNAAGYGGSINLRADDDGNGVGNINFGTAASRIGDSEDDAIIITANTDSITVSGEDVNFYTAGDINITAGSAANTSVDVEAERNQTLDALDDISINGGSGSNSHASASADGNQTVSGDDISLTGGTGANASAILSIDNDGTQTVSSLGKLSVIAGDGLGANAEILDGSVAMTSQYINALGGIDLFSSNNAIAKLYSSLNQVITVGSASNSADFYISGCSCYNTADVISDGGQSITVHGDLILEHAYIQSYGSGGSSNFITTENIHVDASSDIYYSGSNVLTLTTTGNNSYIDAGPSGTFNLYNTYWNQSGMVDWESGDISINSGGSGLAGLNNSGTFYANSESGTRNAGSGTLDIGPTDIFINTGTFEKDYGYGTTILDFNFHNQGRVIASMATLDFGGNSFRQTSGETLLRGGNLSNTGGFNFEGGELNGGVSIFDAGMEEFEERGGEFEGGEFEGGEFGGLAAMVEEGGGEGDGLVLDGGTIIGNVYLTNTTVNPGHSPGLLTIQGNLDASGGGNTFNFELESDTISDQLNISGFANLPSTNLLNLLFTGGYTGPAELDGMAAFSNLISTGGGSFIDPTIVSNGDAGLGFVFNTPSTSNLSLDVTRLFFPEDEILALLEELTDDQVAEILDAIEFDDDDLIVLILFDEDDEEFLGEEVVGTEEFSTDDDDDDENEETKNMCIV